MSSKPAGNYMYIQFLPFYEISKFNFWSSIKQILKIYVFWSVHVSSSTITLFFFFNPLVLIMLGNLWSIVVHIVIIRYHAEFASHLAD